MSGRADEVLRYLGAGSEALKESSEAPALRREAEQLLARAEAAAAPKTLCRVFPLAADAATGTYSLLGADGAPVLTLSGMLAHTMLEGCHKAALLLTTLGLPFDSMLRTQQARGMAQAALLDACGSVLVEEACDRAEAALREECPGLYLTDRFSPGYGDLPLTLQPQLLRALDATRLAGVYLTDTCLMNPSKTVTAIVGLSTAPRQARIRGCAHCALRDTCNLRKDGKRCDSL